MPSAPIGVATKIIIRNYFFFESTSHENDSTSSEEIEINLADINSCVRVAVTVSILGYSRVTDFGCF